MSVRPFKLSGHCAWPHAAYFFGAKSPKARSRRLPDMVWRINASIFVNSCKSSSLASPTCSIERRQLFIYIKPLKRCDLTCHPRRFQGLRQLSSPFSHPTRYGRAMHDAPCKRKQRLRRQVRTKSFLPSCPDRRTIISSLPVISTDGNCLGVWRMKSRSGEI